MPSIYQILFYTQARFPELPSKVGETEARESTNKIISAKDKYQKEIGPDGATGGGYGWGLL